VRISSSRRGEPWQKHVPSSARRIRQRAIAAAERLEHLPRLRPPDDVPGHDDRVRLDLREHGPQRGQVAVHVGEDRETHAVEYAG
jgi:hypothetical protein